MKEKDDKHAMKFLISSSYFKADGNLDWNNIVKKAIVLIAFFIIFFLLLFAFLRPQMQSIALWVTQNLGYLGIFLYALFVDMFIVPLTVDVIFPFSSNFNVIPFLLFLSIGSSIGGLGGWMIGRLLGHLSFIKKITSGFTTDGEQLLKKYGGWAVVIAGLTPIPFSTVCWMSGMVRVPFSHVVLATLSRFPRMIIYYLAVQGGLMIIL